LTTRCGADDVLRGEVESLIDATRKAAEVFERATISLTGAAAALETIGRYKTARVGDHIGPYRVVRELGAGGMGVVYEVHDPARDEVIALKTLLRSDPADILRLKREFRSLADIAHPNVVCLYELVVEERDCFFTMELVKGATFVEYVRRHRDRTRDVVRQLV